MSLVEVTTPSGKKKSVGIAQDQSDGVLTIVVLGASGDLAKKVATRSNSIIAASSSHPPAQLTFPALFALYTSKLMPEKFHVVGVGRQPAAGKPATTAQALRDHLCSNAGTSKAAGAPPVSCARSRVTRLPQFRAQAATSSSPSAPSYTPTTTARRTSPRSRSTALPSRMRCV